SNCTSRQSDRTQLIEETCHRLVRRVPAKRALLYRFGLRLPKGQKLWGLPTKQKLRLSASTCPRKADTNIRRDQQAQRRRVTMQLIMSLRSGPAFLRFH